MMELVQQKILMKIISSNKVLAIIDFLWYYIYTIQSFSSNRQISITNGEIIVKSFIFPKNVDFIIYISRETNSNYKLSDRAT